MGEMQESELVQKYILFKRVEKYEKRAFPSGWQFKKGFHFLQQKQNEITKMQSYLIKYLDIANLWKEYKDKLSGEKFMAILKSISSADIQYEFNKLYQASEQ